MVQGQIDVNLQDVRANTSYRDTLRDLLGHDLNFHGQGNGYQTHNFHSFPAKFPPQLPREFILGLTKPGEVVLDPMAGSGTTIVEALLHTRCGIGFDIDPLAIMMMRAKTTELDPERIADVGTIISRNAALTANEQPDALNRQLETRWDAKTKTFVDYWFAKETQVELLALINEIDRVLDSRLRLFFRLILSGIIITKSGGVSLAFDLAHTRPHKAKVVKAASGEILFGQELAIDPSPRVSLLTKTVRSPLAEFDKRLRRSMSGLISYQTGFRQPLIQFGDAQQLPLNDDSIDLIVTSPPYLSNAIDYMRAHKFSLVWLGYSVESLGTKRKEYIGGESLTDIEFEEMPEFTNQIIARISQINRSKGRIAHRYYSEMARVLREMYRVLKPGKGAVLVVGTSIVQGIDTQIDRCLTDLGVACGFEVVGVGIRQIDRDKRMLPAGAIANRNSQIQQRMHSEYVIGLHKTF